MLKSDLNLCLSDWLNQEKRNPSQYAKDVFHFISLLCVYEHLYKIRRLKINICPGNRKQHLAWIDYHPNHFHLTLSSLSHCRWQNKCFWQSSSHEKRPILSSDLSHRNHRKWACRHLIWFSSSLLANTEQRGKSANQSWLEYGSFCDAAWWQQEGIRRCWNVTDVHRKNTCNGKNKSVMLGRGLQGGAVG